jgi:hypothetical protein
MVLENGTGRTATESRALKDLYGRLLDSLLDAFTCGNHDRMLRPFLNTADGHGLAWRYGDQVRCPLCSGGAWRYERIGSRGVASLVFCPTCRELYGDDLSGRRVVHAKRNPEPRPAGLLPETSFTAASHKPGATLAGPLRTPSRTKH